jgi:hypothetical protein
MPGRSASPRSPRSATRSTAPRVTCSRSTTEAAAVRCGAHPPSQRGRGSAPPSRGFALRILSNTTRSVTCYQECAKQSPRNTPPPPPGAGVTTWSRRSGPPTNAAGAGLTDSEPRRRSRASLSGGGRDLRRRRRPNVGTRPDHLGHVHHRLGQRHTVALRPIPIAERHGAMNRISLVWSSCRVTGRCRVDCAGARPASVRLSRLGESRRSGGVRWPGLSLGETGRDRGDGEWLVGGVIGETLRLVRLDELPGR